MNKTEELKRQSSSEKVRERDNFLCYFCERDIRRGKIKSLASSVHHIVPRRFGGDFQNR